jgi:hypothetical protein
MSLSDHDFNEELDAVVETTIRILRDGEQAEYSPVAFLANGEDFDIIGLDDEEEDPAEAELPRLAREFGEHLAAQRHETPDCAFFAHLSKAEDGAESIVVHGATPEGKANVAYLNVRRDAKGNLQVASSKAWHSPSPIAASTNLAGELLRGMLGE